MTNTTTVFKFKKKCPPLQQRVYEHGSSRLHAPEAHNSDPRLQIRSRAATRHAACGD